MRAPACALWRAVRLRWPGGCRHSPRPAPSCGPRRVAVDVFAALANPTRRRVVSELASRETVTATELASELRVTRQAVAKHLGALTDAGRAAAHRRVPRGGAARGTRDSLPAHAGAARGGGRVDRLGGRPVGRAPGAARAPRRAPLGAGYLTRTLVLARVRRPVGGRSRTV